jgi:hypothetical protein
MVNSGDSFLDARELIREHLMANRDHDRTLATILAEWLGIHSIAKADKCFNGTVGFEYVWEEMVRSAIACVPGVNIIRHGQVASQPKYRTHDGRILYVPGEQRPDVIARSVGGIVILDAKWYRESEYPGTNDVIKQLAYASTANHAVDVNAFVLPKVGGEIELVGNCGLESGGTLDSRFPAVRLVRVPIDALLSAYAQKREGELGAKVLRTLSFNTGFA